MRQSFRCIHCGLVTHGRERNGVIYPYDRAPTSDETPRPGVCISCAVERGLIEEPLTAKGTPTLTGRLEPGKGEVSTQQQSAWDVAGMRWWNLLTVEQRRSMLTSPLVESLHETTMRTPACSAARCWEVFVAQWAGREESEQQLLEQLRAAIAAAEEK